MATAELARPGVEVIQSIRKSSPTFQRPTLAPVIIGPAYEIVDVLTADGTLNSKAKLGVYAQFGRTVTQLQFPDPRGNIDELNVIESSIKPYLYTGGRLRELPMSPGTAFLKASHKASAAVFKVTGNSFALNGTNLVLAVDQPVAASLADDVTVTFTGANPWTAAQIVSSINTAFGYALAAVTLDGNGSATGFEIVSPTIGALSSLTIRAGGSANQLLSLGWTAAGEEWRLVGSGYRAYDLSDNSQTSTWVEFFQGDFYINGVASTWKTSAFIRPVLGATDENAPFSAVVFGSGAGEIPLQAGDLVYADGTQVKSAEVARVDPSRFKLGTINTSLSVADEHGNYVRKIYDDVALGLPQYSAAFAPKYVWFKAVGLSQNEAATAAYLTGSVAATAATQATVEAQGIPPTTPVSLQGLYIDYTLTVDGTATTGRFTFTQSSPFASAAAIAAGIAIDGVSVTDAAGVLRFQTVAFGAGQAFAILGSGTANVALGITGPVSDTGTDDLFAGLPSTVLRFSFDDGAHTYDAAFSATSLDEAIDRINTIAGATVASKDGGRHLVLTSPLTGVGSRATVVGGSAASVFGFADGATAANGTGRPDPDAYLDGQNNLVLGDDLVRDPITGYPLDYATSPAAIYVQYRGLRLDVSPLAAQAGVLRFPDVDTLSLVLDPVDERNPLSLGLFMAMLNCPGFEVKGLGVDETSAAAPEGTELAYARAASFLEAEEVYAMAPLTQNEVVHSTFQTHVTMMSQPEMGGERILFFNRKTPRFASSKLAASGTEASATATANQLQLDVTPQQGLTDAGVDSTLNPIPVSAGVYVEFAFGGVFYRYSVSRVQGGLATLRTTFSVGENDDFFYTTSTLPADVSSASWSMKVRGASLSIPGSSLPDFSKIASTVAEANTGVLNRRAYSIFPESVKTTIAGLEVSVPAYYACAAIAGMTAGLPPAQGHTNYPITGLTGVVGMDRFTRRQLNSMAGGGTYILMQEVQSGPVFSRHQLSTDTTSVETRELSVTKVIDFTAKFLRAGVRRFIGRQNINAVFLDTVGTTIQGMLTFLVENGILNGANLNNIIQDPKAPDTVMVDVTLDVPFPCNYIRLTLVV